MDPDRPPHSGPVHSNDQSAPTSGLREAYQAPPEEPPPHVHAPQLLHYTPAAVQEPASQLTSRTRPAAQADIVAGPPSEAHLPMPAPAATNAQEADDAQGATPSVDGSGDEETEAPLEKAGRNPLQQPETTSALAASE